MHLPARSRSGPLARLTATLLAVLAAVPAATLGAQTSAPMSASLLRRLAEAADAYRTGQPVWFVADPRPPHDIDTALTTPPPADLGSLRMPPGFGVFGPFVTPPDFDPSPVMVFGCVHTLWPVPSVFKPRMCPMRAMPLDSITEMRLVVVTRGEPLEVPLSPGRVDAVFFSVSAFDKFVAPYYARVQGPAYAQALRDSLEAFVRGR